MLCASCLCLCLYLCSAFSFAPLFSCLPPSPVCRTSCCSEEIFSFSQLWQSPQIYLPFHFVLPASLAHRSAHSQLSPAVVRFIAGEFPAYSPDLCRRAVVTHLPSAVDSTPKAFPWFRTPAAPPKDGRMNASRNAQPSNNTGVGSRGVSVQSSSNVPLSSSIVPGRKIGSLMLAPSHAEFYSVENCPLLMEVEEFEVPKLFVDGGRERAFNY